MKFIGHVDPKVAVIKAENEYGLDWDEKDRISCVRATFFDENSMDNVHIIDVRPTEYGRTYLVIYVVIPGLHQKKIIGNKVFVRP